MEFFLSFWKALLISIAQFDYSNKLLYLVRLCPDAQYFTHCIGARFSIIKVRNISRTKNDYGTQLKMFGNQGRFSLKAFFVKHISTRSPYVSGSEGGELKKGVRKFMISYFVNSSIYCFFQPSVIFMQFSTRLNTRKMNNLLSILQFDIRKTDS